MTIWFWLLHVVAVGTLFVHFFKKEGVLHGGFNILTLEI